MSSFMSLAYLLDRYGLRLTVDQLAEVLHLSPRAISASVLEGTFPVPVHVDDATPFADYRDVAAFLDKCRERTERAKEVGWQDARRSPQRWVTFECASERTGFGVPFFIEHTRDGLWSEGVVWKWVLGRKVIDLQAFYAWVDKQPSIPSKRGRKPRG